MLLDMPTVSLVSISVTAILGFILVFAWWQEATSTLAGWWGLAQLVMSLGIIIVVAAPIIGNNDIHAFGQACMILSAAIMWMAARSFEGRRVRALWVFAAPAIFMLADLGDYLDAFDHRLTAVCAVMAAFSLATAYELGRNSSERLISRWPAVVLLIATAIGYLAWLPLSIRMPVHEAGLVFASTWMPWVILVATLERVALAFVVLALVKEREELKQRIDALTDPLTGLPNRRALFAAAERLREHSKYLKGDPISVLVFDSRRSMTPSATASATACCSSLPAPCRNGSRPAASSAGSGARSSRPYCPAPIWRRLASPRSRSAPPLPARRRCSTGCAWPAP